MKNGDRYWLYLLFILIGAGISYVVCQFDYLQIDPKVSVVTSLISISTALIGLYLAISLKKIQSKSSNLHNYLQPKLDLVWKLFLTFSHQLSLKDQIELSEVNKSIKEISLNITPLKKMFSSFGVAGSSINDLESQIEVIEKILVDDCEIKDNIIQYAAKKTQITLELDKAHTLFVASLKVINTIS